MTIAQGRLAGKRIVVTGASSGIGRGVALRCAAEGARVLVVYRLSHAKAAAVVAAIEAAGGEASAVAADVGDPSAIPPLIATARERLGGIDTWCNFAGADILTGAGAKLGDADKLARLLDTDLRGTILCSWAVADELAQARGSIVNMSWDLALRGMGGRNPEMFAAVKAGVTGFTRALARSLAPAVRVNEVAPGWIETAFAAADMAADYRAAVEAATPLGRFGLPADVAAAVVYLASDDAAFITGQTLKVNGGLSS
ncbi:MAG TPA: SDR family oxidoreductase [Gammaproteobacteria bacterium]|nr:SDR family oxidoreductase [Gammaproteobacteria bacterium]